MRYYTEFGCEPNVQGKMTMCGPQPESEIPDEVKDLLNKTGIYEVIVLFDHGQGKRIESFRKMPDDK